MDLATQALSYDLIVTPNHPNNSGGGIVKILFYIDTYGTPQNPDSDLFPTGTCWVSSGYEEYINSKFNKGELFLLRSARLQDVERERVGTQDATNWWAAGKSAERLTGQFIRVLECDLPDIDSGRLDWRGEELQRGSYFILSNDYVYGLFDLTKDTKDNTSIYSATPLANPAIRIDSHHICKVDYNELSKDNLIFVTEFDGEVRKYIWSVKKFGEQIKEPRKQQIDYIPIKQIFSKFIAPLKEPKRKQRILTKGQLNDINSMIDEFLKKTQDSLSSGSERYERAIHYLNNINQSEEWVTLVDAYLKTPEGKTALKSYSNSNSSDLNSDRVTAISSELNEAKEQLNKINAELKVKTEARDIVEAQLEQVKENLEREKQDQENKIQQSLIAKREELEETKKTLLELQKKGEGLEKKYEELSSIDSLQEEITKLESNHSYLQGRADKLKEMLKNPEQSGDALLQVHTIMDLLGYARHTPKEGTRTHRIYAPPSQAIDLEAFSSRDLVSTICNRIRLCGGRELSEVETANLMICIQQNLMTFLQGRPGNGKTSTSLNLAQSLGIHDCNNFGREPDFLNIAVARGWSSNRDLIGFYNSLKGEFQPSQTGLYDFLLNGEPLDHTSNLRMVLLDEANLSPIEHYFSSFISLFDSEGRNTPIDTGCLHSKNRFLHPVKSNNLRFIATINNDSTTEPLSSRLLDRAPVISMDIEDSSLIGGEILSFKGAIPANVLESKFGRKIDSNEIELSAIEDFISKGTKVAPILGDHLHVDGRRKNSIRSYILTATGDEELMDRPVAEDFAISQFLLPHFRGDGIEVSNAIEAMSEFAINNNWIRTSEILERIHREGDAYLHSYSFM